MIVKQKAIRVAIVAAEFDRSIVSVMISAAEQELQRAEAALARVVRVPGAYEIPLTAQAVLGQDDVEALVVLGFIEQGETLHGEVMGQAVHSALLQLQLTHHKPIGIGIIGPGATRAQAESRKVGYSRAAVRAALTSYATLQDLLQ